MNIRGELLDIKRHFLIWGILFFFGVVALCGFSVSVSQGFDAEGFLKPSVSKSLASLFFIQTKNDLLPEGVELIATSPITAFLIHLKIGILGSFVLFLPVLLYSFGRYLSPALYREERRNFLLLTFLSTILFLAGVVFAYRLLVLKMFSALFSFNTSLDVTPYLAADDFISWVLSALIISGVLFLLPIFMYTLAVIRVVGSSFWVIRWREAFVVFLVCASLITPDVSGFSVVLLMLPVACLYMFGIFFAKIHEYRRKKSLSF